MLCITAGDWHVELREVIAAGYTYAATESDNLNRHHVSSKGTHSMLPKQVASAKALPRSSHFLFFRHAGSIQHFLNWSWHHNLKLQKGKTCHLSTEMPK